MTLFAASLQQVAVARRALLRQLVQHFLLVLVLLAFAKGGNRQSTLLGVVDDNRRGPLVLLGHNRRNVFDVHHPLVLTHLRQLLLPAAQLLVMQNLWVRFLVGRLEADPVLLDGIQIAAVDHLFFIRHVARKTHLKLEVVVGLASQRGCTVNHGLQVVAGVRIHLFFRRQGGPFVVALIDEDLSTRVPRKVASHH